MTNTEYMRAWRAARGKPTRPDLWGSVVRVDVDALREWMHRRRITPHELAHAAGIHFTTVYAVLRNGTCKDTTLDRIACALGLHMSELESPSPSDQEGRALCAPRTSPSATSY